MVDTFTAFEVARTAEPMNLFDILAQQVELRPHKDALIYEEGRFTYRQVYQRAAAIASQLRGAGVQKGDRVGILFPNHPDYVASFFAVMALGGTVVPINPLLKSEEIGHILSDSGAVVLIVHESAFGEALKSRSLTASLRKIFVAAYQESNAELRALTKSDPLVEGLSKETIQQSQFARELYIDKDRDLALLVYTSGTTGKPKGAMLTHGNILAVFPRRLSMLDINEHDRTLAVLPMCHIYGITVVMIGALSTGGSLAMLSKFDAVAALEMIQNEKVTIVPAVPAMHRFMLMELDKRQFDVSSVRLCLSGGAALPADLHQDIEQKMGACLEGYALTETACATTLNPLHGKRKVGSVGPAMDGISLRIVDSSGSVLAPGKDNVGEVQVRGGNIMLGYYQQREATREVISSDGWFSTGDLGYTDEDGYLYIVGRKKEMIIRGGQNIYPREIEDVLGRMPGVLEAAVIGVPDQFMGERVKAIIVKHSGAVVSEEDVKTFCAERLAEYKVPRLVEFSDTLPRNSTGKVLKRLL